MSQYINDNEYFNAVYGDCGQDDPYTCEHNIDYAYGKKPKCWYCGYRSRCQTVNVLIEYIIETYKDEYPSKFFSEDGYWYNTRWYRKEYPNDAKLIELISHADEEMA